MFHKQAHSSRVKCSVLSWRNKFLFLFYSSTEKVLKSRSTVCWQMIIDQNMFLLLGCKEFEAWGTTGYLFYNVLPKSICSQSVLLMFISCQNHQSQRRQLFCRTIRKATHPIYQRRRHWTLGVSFCHNRKSIIKREWKISSKIGLIYVGSSNCSAIFVYMIRGIYFDMR